VEAAGGVVIRFSFGTPKMSGISEWIPPAPPMFFLNDDPQISGDRDRFTLAHEIAHVVLHAMPNPNMEKQADDFAGEFLMPEREIRAHFRTPLKLEKLVELKKHWKVSMQSLLEHAFTLGVVNERQRQYLWSQIAARGFRLREPIEIAKEQPTLIKSLLHAHVWQLAYSITELAQTLCITPEEFLKVYPYEEPRIQLVK
jgi:Zn-dependent peptidase ImmA (M78 family)